MVLSTEILNADVPILAPAGGRCLGAEIYRNVSSVNHQRLLNGARFGGRRAKRRGSELSSTVKPAESYPRTEAGAVVWGTIRMQVTWK